MDPSPFLAIAHVQLAMPAGGEGAARRFFVDLCGMTEVPKPAELAKRGGCWLRSGVVEIHLGVEQDFRPARKAHPALICENYDALIAKLKAANVPLKEDFEIPGTRRSHVFDPFGNRIEIIARRSVVAQAVEHRPHFVESGAVDDEPGASVGSFAEDQFS